MLGYLSLTGGRPEIDGLRPGFANEYQGRTYPVHHLDTTALKVDPDHRTGHRGDPSIHATSSARNSGPTLTPPSAANSMPASDACMDAGITWISVSSPTASHGSGKTACRHRAIPDFPELDPPFSPIT
jgi:hypothetical protein